MFFLALAGLLATATPTPTPVPERDASAVWREAEAADHQARDYRKAIALYGELVEKFPAARLSRGAAVRRDVLVHGIEGGEEPFRRFEVVRERTARTDRPAAIREVTALVEKFPESSVHDEMLLWLGDRASDDARWADAETSYRGLLDRHATSPLQGYALAGLAHAAFERGDYDEAERLYRRIEGTSIPGAARIAAGEAGRVRQHVVRRRGMRIAVAILVVVLALGAGTADPRKCPAALKSVLTREGLFVAPPLLLLILIAPADGRTVVAALAAVGLLSLVAGAVWAESLRARFARRGVRAAGIALALLGSASALYATLYAFDALIAVESLYSMPLEE